MFKRIRTSKVPSVEQLASMIDVILTQQRGLFVVRTTATGAFFTDFFESIRNWAMSAQSEIDSFRWSSPSGRIGYAELQLFNAASYGDEQAVRLWLSRGANPAARFHHSVLWVSAARNDCNICRVISARYPVLVRRLLLTEKAEMDPYKKEPPAPVLNGIKFMFPPHLPVSFGYRDPGYGLMAILLTAAYLHSQISSDRISDGVVVI